VQLGVHVHTWLGIQPAWHKMTALILPWHVSTRGISRSLLVVMRYGQDGDFASQLAQIDDPHGPSQMHYSTIVCII